MMTVNLTAFRAGQQIASGGGPAMVRALHGDAHKTAEGAVLVFDDRDGRVMDLDLRGTLDDALARLAYHPYLAPSNADGATDEAPAPSIPPKRGRPKLGVTSREISLLPRHWTWIRGQGRSASALLRDLVEARMRAGRDADPAKAAQTAAYTVMAALAGDWPDFEEASRALFGGDSDLFQTKIGAWPTDVQAYLNQILAPS